jgi:hypothetical protein
LFVPAHGVGKWDCRCHPGTIVDGVYTCCRLPFVDGFFFLAPEVMGADALRGCRRVDHLAPWDARAGPDDGDDPGDASVLLAISGTETSALANMMRRPGTGALVETPAQLDAYVRAWLRRRWPGGAAAAPAAAGMRPEVVAEATAAFCDAVWTRVLDLEDPAGLFFALARRLASAQPGSTDARACGAAAITTMARPGVKDLFRAFLINFDMRPPAGLALALGGDRLTPLREFLLGDEETRLFYRRLAEAVAWLCARARNPTESGTTVGRTFLSAWRDRLVPELKREMQGPVLLPFFTVATRAAAPDSSVLATARRATRILDETLPADLLHVVPRVSTAGPHSERFYLEHFDRR